MTRYLMPIVALLAFVVAVDGGPIRNFIHRLTHPFEGRRTERQYQQAAPQVVPQAVPQPLPKGPEKAADPFDAPGKKVTPTPSVSKIFLKHNQLPPPCEAGFHWTKTGCGPLGCEWVLTPKTKGSAASECPPSCTCGCQEGGHCTCARRK